MSADERRRLLDERRLLEASLADAAAEHESGELDDAGLEKITERDRRRLSEVDEALGRLVNEPDDGSSGQVPAQGEGAEEVRPRRRWGLLVLGALAIFVAVGALVVNQRSHQAGPTTAEVATYLVRADAFAQQGKISEALALYAKVLAADPTQPEALAQSGFLTFEAGLSASSVQLTARGEAQVRQAAKLAPKDYAPKLYLGVIELLANNDPVAALAEFDAFSALHPPAKWVKKAQPFISKAKDAVAGTTSTTSPG
jgi:tetratricopeptide (TPR) repeat protein